MHGHFTTAGIDHFQCMSSNQYLPKINLTAIGHPEYI